MSIKKEYKRLKLDKFVAGTNQRIFKTTTSIIKLGERDSISGLNNKLDYSLLPSSTLYDNCKLNEKNVFFGDFFIDTNNTTKNTEFTSKLINFHDIHSDYISNKPENANENSPIDSIESPWFPQAINTTIDAKKQNKQNETIVYFPEYINTPIDLTYSENNVNFLLPISTEKYINIAQSESLLNMKNYYTEDYLSKKNVYRNNYANILSSQIFQGAYTSEDNSIPVYNLNYSNLESIYLKNTENVNAFIEKYKLTEIPLKTFVFNNESMDTNNYNSILLKPLMKYMLENPSRFDNNLQREIIVDLISSMDNDFDRLLNVGGYIRNIDNSVISSFISGNILSAMFARENITNISKMFTEEQYYANESTYIPQNVMINTPLNLTVSGKTKQYAPTVYFNITYLKNNRNPHYNINCNIDKTFPEYNISIDSKSAKPISISSNLSGEQLLDVDITYSKELNEKRNNY